jgi:DNA-binding protein H-NS
MVEAMTNMKLESMSLDELMALSKSISAAIKTYEARKLKDARAELEAKARELGVSLEAVMSVSVGRAKSAVAAKYRHPENSELTWTGRGRTPKWVVAHEAQGGSRNDLLIK